MLKKRSREDFKSELRQKIERQANGVKHGERMVGLSEKISGFLMGRRLVPVTAFVLLIAITVAIINPFQGGQAPFTLVNVADAKDYYELKPVDSDETGVQSESGFVLTSKDEVSAKAVSKALKVTPEVEVSVTQNAENEVLITPAEDLKPGEVYSFELDSSEVPGSQYTQEFSWAFQVSDEFAVTGTLPGNEQTYVPMNSGIEVYFNYRGVSEEDFKNHFSISPAVNGTFKVEGKTGVFMPASNVALEAETVYTVTISSGLSLAGSENSLKEDYVFSFETDSSSAYTVYLGFDGQNQVELAPSENAQFRVSYYNRTDGEDKTVNVKLYAFDSGEAFLAAMQDRRNSIPSWSYYANRNYLLSTKELKLVAIDESSPVLEADDGWRYVDLGRKLTIGYYLLEISKNGEKVQQFVQVSNTAAYLNLNKNSLLVWVNDEVSGTAIQGAEVTDLDNEKTGKTNKDGIVEFDQAFEDDYEDMGRVASFLKISANGHDTYYDNTFYSAVGGGSDYWELFETDREVYQPDDKVYYWGFLQGRKDSVSGEAKLIVMDSNFYSRSSLDEIEDENNVYYSEELNLNDGVAFDGSFDIKKFKPGYYYIIIYKENKQIALTYFTVEPYIKPAYQIVLDSDKDVVFAGETIHTDISSKFFEGTPVPDTEIRYELPDDQNGTLVTNENGETAFDFEATSYYKDCNSTYYCNLLDYQSFTVKPMNEELADIQETKYFRVFRSSVAIAENDVERDGLMLDLKNVDLGLINNSISEWDDYNKIYSGPAQNAKADISIVRVDEWDEQVGEYYDNIQKVVQPIIKHHRDEVTEKTMTLYSDENGKINYAPSLQDGRDYYIDVKVYDEQGRFVKNRYYIQKKTYSQQDYLELKTDRSDNNYDNSYSVGETVQLSVVDAPTDDGDKYLFLITQNGLVDFKVTEGPNYEMKFTKDMIPNVYVYGMRFDGKEYKAIYGIAVPYKKSERALEVNVSSDKDSYEPGETVTLDIAVSAGGSGKAAQVQLNLIDEAYYSLFAENFIDPLDKLYSPMYKGVYKDYASHTETAMSEGDRGGCFGAGTLISMSDGTQKKIEDIKVGDSVLTREAAYSGGFVSGRVTKTFEHEVGGYILVNGKLHVTHEHVVFANGQWKLAGDLELGDQMVSADGDPITVESIEKVREEAKVYNFEVEKYHTYIADGFYVHNDKGGVREDFKDTALFKVVSTDASGHASVTFDLPDNITSWRLTASAVSGGGDIYAGFGNLQIEVSKDVFALPVVNTQYLTGDKASIPVRAFGVALKSGDSVSFSVESESLGYSEKKEGEAFQNTYFDLPEMTVGEHSLIAGVKFGDLTDYIKQEFTVEDTHMTKNSLWEDDLSAGLTLEGSDTERTDVYFMNGEAGQIFPVLKWGSLATGHRIDQILFNVVSRRLLNEYFGENLGIQATESLLYQNVTNDGGIALLPYGDSDLKLSAQIAAIDSEDFNVNGLRSYFESILDSENETLSRKILAIYGLSSLGESHLTELNYFVGGGSELTLEDKIFSALTYEVYGADNLAADLFVDIMDSAAQDEDGLKITAEGASKDDELSWTAYAAVLGAQLDSQDTDSLWKFVKRNDRYWEEDRMYLINLEKLLYARVLLERGAQAKVSFKLNGSKVVLKNSAIHRESMLPKELKAASFSDLSGEVRVMTAYRDALDLGAVSTDNRISVTRSYSVNGVTTTTFKPGDLVEVHFNIQAPADLNGAYRVTDYLPSGLQTSTTPFSFWDTSYIDPGSSYRHPYKTDQQEVSFFVWCNKDEGLNENFYYLARVINKGEFVAEPATLQSYLYPDRFNVSGGKERVTIE
ncbi:Ig-like domain-containing protein [Patescibacteria group bacterium]|nr:Ig-like domain-containing protein [Patescibacteria group bacterium]